jgi:hypothetical protein
VVALRNNERLFGDAALNTVSWRKRERERERERERDRLTCTHLASLTLCMLCVVRKEGNFLVYMLVRVVEEVHNQTGRKLEVMIFLTFFGRLLSILRVPTDISSF